MQEEWRAVVGYSDYEVSNLGRVRSLDRINVRGFHLKGKILKHVPVNGYPTVQLWRDGKEKRRFPVHRLVLTAFVGECPEGTEGCHNDGNPANCVLSNLRWDTHVGNVQDTVAHGTRAVGHRLPQSKLSEASVQRIFKMRAEGMTHHEIAAVFGVHRNAVTYALARKTWTHVEIDPDLLATVEAMWNNQAGERSSQAVLTEADVLEIYRMRKAGHLYREIAEALGVSMEAVNPVINGRSWKHLYHHYTDEN